MKDNRTSVPVIMYHSVGKSIPEWKWSFLTVPAKVFEDHLRWLARAGYRTVDLQELYDHVSCRQALPPRSVVLTFDDGYVDNWTYVAPLLSRYGFKGTVYVNPEFIDPRNTIRPTLEDVWAGRVAERDLEVRGFMSWPELKRVNEAGTLSVQSHGMSHTWYAISPEVVDFHHPGDGYYWMDWNAEPERKPFYLLYPNSTKVPFGVPIYKHAKSLEAVRFFTETREGERLASFVQRNGGIGLFETHDWRDVLSKELERIRAENSCQGRHETQEEQEKRYRFELVNSKRIIEERLGPRVNFFCWPGGGYNEKTMAMALDTYDGVTLGSADPSPIRNKPDDNPGKVRRCVVPVIGYKGRVYYPGGRYFVRFLDEYRGVPFARQRRQVLKIFCLLGAVLKMLS